jgi:methylmalonyl-CoA decarboxylase
MPLVTAVVDSTIATVTLRRSAKLNSLNEEMILELQAALRAAEAEARVVVIRAEPGVKVFSAGHDISDVAVGVADPSDWENPVEELLAGIPNLAIPVIAAVEGSVWGAACNLVVACDIVVATRTSSFAITPAKLGVPYFSEGIAEFAAALPLHVAKEMFLTAQPLSADDAHRWGLVNRVVADESELTSAVAQIAAGVAALAPLTLHSVKAEFAAVTGARPPSPETVAQLTELRRRAWRSEDFREGVAAFTERRRPVFRGR